MRTTILLPQIVINVEILFFEIISTLITIKDGPNITRRLIKEACLLSILWRSSADQNNKVYKLNIVTYGTAAALYLAIKTLQQLATNSNDKDPNVERIIIYFYADDILSGANALKEAKQLISELTAMLTDGGFHLRKWVSNHK